MLDLPPLTAPIVAAAVAVVGAYAVFERCYVSVPPNEALVLYGRRSERAPRARPGAPVEIDRRAPRILLGGGTLIAPWNRNVARLSLAPIEVETSVRTVHGVEGSVAEGWELSLRVQAKIPAEPRAVQAAAENLLGLAEEERRAYLRRSVEAAVPAVLARVRPAEPEPDWERLGSEIQATLAPELVTVGLMVRSVAVTGLRRITGGGRSDRPVEPKRRIAAGREPAETGPRPGSEARLGRVEHGLRALAADLARLLRDEPPASPEESGPWAAPSGPAAPPLHDSIANGASGVRPARPAWDAPIPAEAGSDAIG